MNANATERKYAMIRLASGDYLLPSNDGGTLWRLRRYDEDGTLFATLDDGSQRAIVGTFWRLMRFRLPLARLQADPDLIDEWNWEAWEEFEGLLPSRRAAIDAAMRRSAER